VEEGLNKMGIEHQFEISGNENYVVKTGRKIHDIWFKHRAYRDLRIPDVLQIARQSGGRPIAFPEGYESFREVLLNEPSRFTVVFETDEQLGEFKGKLKRVGYETPWSDTRRISDSGEVVRVAPAA